MTITGALTSTSSPGNGQLAILGNSQFGALVTGYISGTSSAATIQTAIEAVTGNVGGIIATVARSEQVL